MIAAFAGFPIASRELARGRELQRRIDTKFLANRELLAALAAPLAGHYAVLHGSARYRSLYFDTPDFLCFHDHRRGRRIRHKVRIRHYPDRGCSFFEIKTKRNELVTDKQRLELPYGQDNLERSHRALASTVGLPGDALVPALWIEYRRLTLANLTRSERLTIDVDLEVMTLDGRRYDCGDLAVIEVKQAPFSPFTPVMRALAAAGAGERSMSKYASAIARLVPGIRCNRLLPALRYLPTLRLLPRHVEKEAA